MSTKKLTEVEAVNVIHKALEPFDAAGRAKILRAIISLLEVEPLGNTTNTTPATNLASGGISTTNLANVQIAQFVAAKKSVNTYQRLACLAYHLEHHDQLTELTAKDLTKANAAARQPKISNITPFLGDATTKYGFFAAVGGGKKTLTPRGAAVVEALPDQEAVKKVLQEIPAPRQSGRRSKPKANK